MKIQIENHNGRLRLRWDDGDKRQTLAIGVNDSPLGRTRKRATKAVAKTVALKPVLNAYSPTAINGIIPS